MASGSWIFAAACSLLLSLEAGAAALYYIGAEAGETMPLKWVTGLDVVYDDSVVGSMASVRMQSDTQSALAWVASPREREIPAGLVEAWLTAGVGLHESLDESAARIRRGRDRARGGIAPWVSDRPDGAMDPGELEEAFELDPDVFPIPERIVWLGETRWGSNFDLLVLPVPEPSAALLAALGAVAFVFHRRCPVIRRIRPIRGHP